MQIKKRNANNLLRNKTKALQKRKIVAIFFSF